MAIEDRREHHPDLVPRPPPVRSTTDFIIIVFVIMVAVILTSVTFVALILALFTDKNVGPYLAMITELMTTIISALASPTLFQYPNGGRRRANGSSGASAAGNTFVSSAQPTTAIEPSSTPPSSALQRRGASRASAKPPANVAR